MQVYLEGVRSELLRLTTRGAEQVLGERKKPPLGEQEVVGWRAGPGDPLRDTGEEGLVWGLGHGPPSPSNATRTLLSTRRRK